MYKASRNAAFIALFALLALSGCDSLDDLLGDDSRLQKPLAGDRIAVLNYQSELRVDALLEDEMVDMLPAQPNFDFNNETQLQQAGIENIKLTSFSDVVTAEAGLGYGWEESGLVQQPVIGNGVLYAMDAHGIISAHDARDVEKVLWRAHTAPDEEHEEIGGGGLAYDRGVIYATTGYGSILALVAADGSLLWRQETDVPIRAAPAAIDGQVYAVTIDNQLLAFAARTGQVQWSHRGIKESAVYLGTVTPVAENGIVVAAYSSGEIFALRADDGTPLWSDTLIATKRTSASAVLTGIDATPLIRNNIVYAISNNGLMAANLLTNGRGLWDMELSGYHTPWIAGEYLFVLTANHELVALHNREKRIKWITDLRRLNEDEEEEEDVPAYTAPVMLNGELVLFSADGNMLSFSPETGALIGTKEIPDGVRCPPVFSEGRMYLLDEDATLYQYQ